MAIKQGNTIIVEYGVGSESATAYMFQIIKPITTKIQISTILINEYKKKIPQNNEVLVQFKNAYRQKIKYIEPISVVRCPIRFGKYFILIDGHHRLQAAKLAGLLYIDAIESHHSEVTYGSVPE